LKTLKLKVDLTGQIWNSKDDLAGTTLSNLGSTSPLT